MVMKPREIHRREIEIRAEPEVEGFRDVAARVQDQRLHGFTWVGAHVTPPGPVHDMSARLRIDVRSGRIERARGEMALAAFEGTPDTGFEGCRDILPNLRDLAGLALDDALVPGIRSAIGRARGCYHLTTLVLTSAPLLRGLLADSLPGSARCLRRLELRGIQVGVGRYRFEGELLDERAGSALPPVRLRFEVEARDMQLREVSVERGLAPDPETEALFGGMSLAAGFAKNLVERVTGAAREPVRELALGLSSIVTQVLIAEAVPGVPASTPKPKRANDTCWMWREGGPLQRMEVGVGDEPPN